MGAHRRRRSAVISAEEFVGRLRDLYVHLAAPGGHPVARLSRASGVPYETLRHFLDDEKHLLCPVSEEKLARELGRDGVFFRWLIGRHARHADWKERCTAAWRRCVRVWMALPPVLAFADESLDGLFQSAAAAMLR